MCRFTATATNVLVSERPRRNLRLAFYETSLQLLEQYKCCTPDLAQPPDSTLRPVTEAMSLLRLAEVAGDSL